MFGELATGMAEAACAPALPLSDGAAVASPATEAETSRLLPWRQNTARSVKPITTARCLARDETSTLSFRYKG